MKDFSHLNHETRVAIDAFLRHAKFLAGRSKNRSISDKTIQDYTCVAKRILKKCSVSKQSLDQFFHGIDGKSTFYKGIAALKFYITDIGIGAVKTLIDSHCPIADHNIKKAAFDIQQLITVIQNGMQGKRKKRISKRSALAGLPSDWCEQICNYNKKSKYYEAFLVTSITGCRPAELCNGVLVSHRNNGSEDVLVFKIWGVKVTDVSGYVWREITYKIPKPEGIYADLIELVRYDCRTISIESAVNFTVEIRRIAEGLWSNHKHNITAYCFKHQFAANLKALGYDELISRALGHKSLKTKKLYGHRSQSRGAPLEISVVVSEDLSAFPTSSDDGVEPR